MLAMLGTGPQWAGFIAAVLVLLVLDLGVLHRDDHEVSQKEALVWSIVWVALSLGFCGLVWHWGGGEAAQEFLAAYLIEKSLSVDNLFVFLVIFRYIRVGADLMHRVLFAGIVGALVLRAAFILAGIRLIEHFSWTLYLFGAFLLYTGFHLLVADEEAHDPSESFTYRIARRVIPMTRRYVNNHFFVRRGRTRVATPLFLVLVMIETSDVVFALDSIPAVFAITRDPFIAFTSNVCAVLGLRAMFFLLKNILDRFSYLKYGLGLVLAFIGVKMILAEGLGALMPAVHVPTSASLGIIGSLIGGSMLASAVLPAPEPDEAGEGPSPASSLIDGPAPAGPALDSDPSRSQSDSAVGGAKLDESVDPTP